MMHDDEIEHLAALTKFQTGLVLRQASEVEAEIAGRVYSHDRRAQRPLRSAVILQFTRGPQ